MYLTTPDSKKGVRSDILLLSSVFLQSFLLTLAIFYPAITESHIVELMRQFSESSNTRLSNLATVFLEVSELN